MSDMFCPSCGAGQLIIDKCVVVTPMISVSFVMYIRCANCAMVSEVDPDGGALVDMAGISMAVLFERQQPRFLINYGSLRGRNDS